MVLVLKDTEQAVLTATFTDIKGHPTIPSQPPVWAVTDPAIITVIIDGTPSYQGLVSILRAMAVGEAAVTCTVTLDSGRFVVLTLDVQVVPGVAVGGSLTAGPPTEQ
jgi:hypothetical protein